MNTTRTAPANDLDVEWEAVVERALKGARDPAAAAEADREMDEGVRRSGGGSASWTSPSS